MQHDDGFVYCYGNLYGLMLYWGLVTFRVQSPGQGGAASTGWTVAYALVTRLLVVSCFLGSVFVKLNDPEMAAAIFSHLKPLDKAIITWECLSCSITYLEYCLSMDAQRRRHQRLITSLQEFDRNISEQFPRVKWNYQRTRKKYWYGTVIVSFCFFSFTIALIFDITRCTCGIPSSLLLAFTYTLLTSSIGLVGFVHIAIMDFVRLRMRLIQKLLQKLYQEGDGTGAGQQELHERIAHLSVNSKRCSSLLVELNSVFGFGAAAGFFYDFTIMTCFVYVICQKLLSRESWDMEYAFMLLHVAIHSYKVIITSTYGYLVQREKRNCLHMMGNYASHFPGQDFAQQQTEDFQHWRMHNRQAALVGSSINLNLSTIYLVYNGMANYVIILVQLLFQQLQIKERQQSLGRDVDIVGRIGPITHMD